MLKRGYIILLAGAALVVIGISLTAAYGIGIAGVILNESVILSDVLVDTSNSVNRTLDIINTERPVSIALHAETINSTDNPVVEQEDGQSDIFTSFRPETDGIYTLSLHNLGADQVKIEGIFGYLPITENSGEINLSTVTGLLAGAWVFVIGIGTLVGGTVITVLDRRGDKYRQSLGLTK
jgi:hypothetical protein